MTTSNTYVKMDTPYVGAGIILMRMIDNTPQFLMLKGRRSNVWSFPKGHPEIIDANSPLRTAVRETKEETGLVNGINYTIVGDAIRFGKRPYWLGIVHGETTVILCSHEHTEWCWATCTEIQQMDSNTDVRAWVKKTIVASNWTRLVDSAVSIMPALISAN
jgi:8-oxo-dGTP pyrophosphatase MutT (NUDIX family)